MHTSAWKRLAEALNRILEITGGSPGEAQADLCRAMADGSVQVRAKLGLHSDGITRMAGTTLDGAQFSIPRDLQPEEIDWDASRPLKPWLVPRGGRPPHGFWYLEWIEVSVADVAKAFGRATTDDQAPALRDPRQATRARRTRPASEGAERAVEALYHGKIPTQVEVPNATLFKNVGAWLKSNGLPDVSNDTILRAAGRRA